MLLKWNGRRETVILNSENTMRRGKEAAVSSEIVENSDYLFSSSVHGASSISQKESVQDPQESAEYKESSAKDQNHHKTSGSETNEVEEDSDNNSLLFKKRVLFAISEGNSKFKTVGSGVLKIMFDDTVFGYNVYMNTDNGDCVCDHIIAIETVLHTWKERAIWAAIDVSLNPPRRRKFRATFNSMNDLYEFKTQFQDGKEAADSSEIVENADYLISLSEHGASSVSQKEFVQDSQGVECSAEGQNDDESSRLKTNKDENDSDNDYSLLFERRVLFEICEGNANEFETVGTGVLKIMFDDTVFGYNVYMNTDNGDCVCDHIIAIQTELYTEKKRATWAAIDASLDPPRRRKFRATFNSRNALFEFEALFQEGKEAAITFEIVEKADYLVTPSVHVTSSISQKESVQNPLETVECNESAAEGQNIHETSGLETNEDEKDDDNDSLLFEKRVLLEMSEGNGNEFKNSIEADISDDGRKQSDVESPEQNWPIILVQSISKSDFEAICPPASSTIKKSLKRKKE